MNKNFIVIVRQAGEGCDYTIDCGQKAISIIAMNMRDAEDKFTQMLQEDFDPEHVDWTDDTGQYYGEQALASAVIFEVSGMPTKIDVNRLYNQIAHDKERMKNMKTEEDEKAELQRLLNKYGDTRNF